MSRILWLVVAATALTEPIALAQSAPAQTVRVVAFSGIPTMALRVAEQRGLFAQQGLQVITEITPNSEQLRQGLAAGKYDIAHAAVDNAVAMVEAAHTDVIVVLGGDDSMNEVLVQPDVATVADLKGRTVIVDAANTAYALQLRKILASSGLSAGDYTLKIVGGTPQRLEAMLADRSNAASMLNPPFSIRATRAGLRSLGTAKALLGPYQGMGAFVKREWASANRDTVIRYLTAVLQAQRWFVAPENKVAATALLGETLRLDPSVATETYARGISGLATDAKLDTEGLARVLALRADVEGQWNGRPPDASRYYDLSFYQAALAAADDERAVRDLVRRYVDARERRDPAAIRSLFTSDADQFTTSGDWRRGREAIVTGTAASSERNPGTRAIEILAVRFVSSDVALADGRYEVRGAAGVPRPMWTTFVATRGPDGWRIAAIRNMRPTGLPPQP